MPGCTRQIDDHDALYYAILCDVVCVLYCRGKLNVYSRSGMRRLARIACCCSQGTIASTTPLPPPGPHCAAYLSSAVKTWNEMSLIWYPCAFRWLPLPSCTWTGQVRNPEACAYHIWYAYAYIYIYMHRSQLQGQVRATSSCSQPTAAAFATHQLAIDCFHLASAGTSGLVHLLALSFAVYSYLPRTLASALHLARGAHMYTPLMITGCWLWAG